MTSRAMTGGAEGASVSAAYRGWVLVMLMLLYMFNFIDRSILNTVGQAVKQDLGLSDLELGLLGGTAFALFNGGLAIPVARLADRFNRVTILSVAAAFWSAMTVLCGFTQTYGQLLLARMGVGAGEAGGAAPSQSLISDYFPPHRRSLALSVYVLGVPLGILLGAIGSGWISENVSWRAAFVIVGAPGVLLAIVTWLTVREPPRGRFDLAPDTGETPSLLAVLRRVGSKRSFLHMVTAGVIVNFAALGLLQFLHPYFVRQFEMDYTQAASLYGVINGVSSGAGFFLGGWLTDRLGARDVRFYAWVPAIGMLCAVPLYVAGLLQSDWRLATALLLLPGLFVSTYFAPTFAVAHNLVGPRMRASVTAIAALLINVVGGAGGPAAVGFLSDRFAAQAFEGEFGRLCAPGGGELPQACGSASAAGLQQALVLIVLLFLWAGVHYVLAGRALSRDLGEPTPGAD